MYQWEEVGESGNYTRYGIARMPTGVVEILGGGTTSLVGLELLDDGNVLKYPLVAGECSNEFAVEVAIYEALGEHPRIIRFVG